MKTEQEVLQMVEQAFADYEMAYRKVKLDPNQIWHYNACIGRLYALREVAGVSNQDKGKRISTIWQMVDSSL